MRLYKTFKESQTKQRFIGTVEIVLKGIDRVDTALTDFIEYIFKTKDIQFVVENSSLGNKINVRLLIKNYDMYQNSDVDDLLDKCVLLNTYLSYYLMPMNVITDYAISYWLVRYKDIKDFNNIDSQIQFTRKISKIFSGPFKNASKFCITGLVIHYSSAKEKNDDSIRLDENKFYDYDYIYTKLAKNLEKEVSRK